MPSYNLLEEMRKMVDTVGSSGLYASSSYPKCFRNQEENADPNILDNNTEFIRFLYKLKSQKDPSFWDNGLKVIDRIQAQRNPMGFYHQKSERIRVYHAPPEILNNVYNDNEGNSDSEIIDTNGLKKPTPVKNSCYFSHLNEVELMQIKYLALGFVRSMRRIAHSLCNALKRSIYRCLSKVLVKGNNHTR
ncbi:hypothetical protein I4U23_031277 [Adineta vaga]|nr:hypothetical protein I4U23_031277 [Adineta vaga]